MAHDIVALRMAGNYCERNSVTVKAELTVSLNREDKHRGEAQDNILVNGKFCAIHENSYYCWQPIKMYIQLTVMVYESVE